METLQKSGLEVELVANFVPFTRLSLLATFVRHFPELLMLLEKSIERASSNCYSLTDM